MPHPAPRGLGTHSLSGTSLLPGAPWDGAGQAACSRPPPGPPRREPTLTATDTTRAPFAGDTEPEPSVRLAGCPCPTAGRRCRHSDTLSDAGEHVRSALVPKASTPPTPGGEQAADPPEGTGRAWAGAGRWRGGGRWLFLMSSDDGPCLSPQAEGHSRRAGLQGAGGRLGARHTVHGRTGVAGSRASAESRSALRRPGEAEAAASGLRVHAAGVERGGGCGPTRPLLTPRHPALPLLGSRCLRRGRGVILTLPPPRLHLCSGVLQQVLRVLSIPQRCPRDTGRQEPSEPNSLACPALPTEPRTWPWQEAGDGGTWRGTGQRCAHRRTGHGVLTASQF